MSGISPFKIKVADEEIDDLKARLKNARWPEQATLSGWEQGVPLDYAVYLMDYWRKDYNWRECESYLNGLPHFSTVIDNQEIAFIHVKSKHEEAKPLILTHGWPGSVIEFVNVIEPLVNPVENGGSEKNAFHLVLPSIPGFGFAEKPSVNGWGIEKVASAWTELMRRLGYDSYYAQGGDWGSAITTQIGISQSHVCKGMHLNMALVHPSEGAKENITDFEKEALRGVDYYMQSDSGYSKIQSTKPQTIGYGLVDSPVAQATWIIDKFWRWTDCRGNLDNAVTRKHLFDNISFYWFSKAGASSARIYWESFNKVLTSNEEVLIPTGISVFPKEIFRASERWCRERYKNLVYYNQLTEGGHFAALEKPEEFVKEIRKAFDKM